jgi:neutral trehalase
MSYSFPACVYCQANDVLRIFQALSEFYSKKTVQYISDEAIRTYLGGIPTSLELTNEQWDFPNAWPPLQIIAIQGLANTEDPAAKDLAYDLARNWVYANHKGYLDAKEMFEKVRIRIIYVRFQVLTAASMTFRIVFWDVLPCKMIVDRRFRGHP